MREVPGTSCGMSAGCVVVFSENDAGYVRDEVCRSYGLEGCLSNLKVFSVVAWMANRLPSYHEREEGSTHVELRELRGFAT